MKNVRRLAQLETIRADLFREHRKMEIIIRRALTQMNETETKKFHMAHAKELTRPVAPIIIYPLTRKMPKRGDA